MTDPLAIASPFLVGLPDEPSPLGLHAAREPGRECEKTGLVEMVLARERYGSILELGCGTGELAHLISERCGSYTGMDVDAGALMSARCRVVAGSPMRFVPLTLPLSLPRGEHELVVLSEVLSLLDIEAAERVARALLEHVPCREIVVVGTCDGMLEDGDPAFDAFVAALDGEFVHEPLALRRHYRIDALLR